MTQITSTAKKLGYLGASAGFGNRTEDEMESCEECLGEAAECDRLAGLAKTLGARRIMQAAAFKWRQLAERAASREQAYAFALPELMLPRC